MLGHVFTFASNYYQNCFTFNIKTAFFFGGGGGVQSKLQTFTVLRHLLL